MGKKKEEPFSLDELKKEVKNKSKKETKMKNIKNNSTVKTVLTVAITLLTVAAFIGTFIAGMNYQKSQDDTIKREALNLSQQLSKTEAVE